MEADGIKRLLFRDTDGLSLIHILRASDSDFPYTQHTIGISGVTADGENRRLLSRLAWLRRRKEEIDDFIDGIEDSLTRRIFEKMYIEGDTKPTWVKVAMDIGGGNTAGGIQMIHKRYLEKTQSC